MVLHNVDYKTLEPGKWNKFLVTFTISPTRTAAIEIAATHAPCERERAEGAWKILDPTGAPMPKYKATFLGLISGAVVVVNEEIAARNRGN